MTKTTSKRSKKSSIDTNAQTLSDLKNSVLVISLLINAFILTGWITLQVTSQYDGQVASFLHLL